jgi:hypothetical protein
MFSIPLSPRLTDVDTEHQYIMDRALRSYREHRAKETPPAATKQCQVIQDNTESPTPPQPMVPPLQRQRSQSARLSRPSRSTQDAPYQQPTHPYFPVALTSSVTPSTRPNTPASPLPGPTLHNSIDIDVHPSHITQWKGRPSTAQARLGIRNNSQSSQGSASPLRASSHQVSPLRAPSSVRGPVTVPTAQSTRVSREINQSGVRELDRYVMWGTYIGNVQVCCITHDTLS